MDEQVPCLQCRHANPLENRFCGLCGASLASRHGLVPRREGALTTVRRTVPAKLGPTGKAVAVGLVTLAVEVGLSWLRHRTKAEDRSSTLATREHDTAVSERLLGQRLEEVLIQDLEGDYRSRTFAWQAIRSIVVTEWTSTKKSSAGGSRGAGSGAGFRASSSPCEKGR